MQSLTLSYGYGTRSGRQIQTAVDQIVSDLADPQSDIAQDAIRLGLDPIELNDLKVTVREDKQGVEPVSTTILIAILTKLGTYAAEQAWEKLIWPAVRRRLDARALGERKL
jgi:hypothetical protein